MAEVWIADAVFEGGESYPVAIKRVLPDLEKQNPLYRSMFEDEARLGMLLRHNNIVRVYDARDVGGTFIMVMELVDGTSLKSLLTKAQERGAPMPVPAALHIARELCRALDYAHNVEDSEGNPLGIVHRDVSPHNLLLGKDGAVKLADFGLADAEVHETCTGDLVGGKLGYLAPEVVAQVPTDHRIDVFAAGIVLWEMLAGRRLFHRESDGETVRAVHQCQVPPLSLHNRRVPKEVEVLVQGLLMRDPDRRIAHCGEAVDALDTLIARVGSGVGPSDVSLLVSLHVATEVQTTDDAPDLAVLLTEELEAFAAAAAGRAYDLGAKPLDPGEFDIYMMGGSGVRQRPEE